MQSFSVRDEPIFNGLPGFKFVGAGQPVLPTLEAPGKQRGQLNLTETTFRYCTGATANPCDSYAGNDSFNLARLGDSSLHHWSGTNR
jgi:hypothetical protein